MIYDEVAEQVMVQNRPLASLKLKPIQESWGEQVEILCGLTGGEDWAAYMETRFEFTIVGVIMTKDETLVFHAGDGYFVVNGRVTKLSAPENAPGYPIYPFLPGISASVQQLCWIKTEPVMKTSDVRSIILATDGAEYLPENIGTMSGYQATADLQYYLTKLQTPRLESAFDNPSAVSRLGKPQAFTGESRADVKVGISIDMTAAFSATLKKGPLGDDLAMVVITKDGSVRRQHVDVNAAQAASPPTTPSLLGSALNKIGSILGTKKGDS
jgi:hypothetical protein